MKRLALIVGLLLCVSACIIGDPRNTNIENHIRQSISVSYLDGSFNIGNKIEVAPGASGDLYPNYSFQKLRSLKIREGQRISAFSETSLLHLAKACSGSCTLAYHGGGVISIRIWQSGEPD